MGFQGSRKEPVLVSKQKVKKFSRKPLISYCCSSKVLPHLILEHLLKRYPFSLTIPPPPQIFLKVFFEKKIDMRLLRLKKIVVAEVEAVLCRQNQSIFLVRYYCKSIR